MDAGKKLHLFGEDYRAFSNETYNEIMRAIEHLASDTFVVLGRKAEAERRAILDKAQKFCTHPVHISPTGNPALCPQIGTSRHKPKRCKQRTTTHRLPFRKRMLYPSELRGLLRL